MCVHCTLLSTFLLCEFYNQICGGRTETKATFGYFCRDVSSHHQRLRIFFPLEPYNTQTYQVDNLLLSQLLKLGHGASLYVLTLNQFYVWFLVTQILTLLTRIGSHKSGKKKVKNCNRMLTDTSSSTQQPSNMALTIHMLTV